MKNLLVICITIVSFTVIVSNLSSVSAQGNAPSRQDFDSWLHTTLPSPNLTTATSHAFIGDIIFNLYPYIFGAAILLVLLFIVVGGFQVLVSQGDPKQTAAGREKITYAIVGFIIMFAAYFIVKLFGEILDIEQIRMLFG